MIIKERDLNKTIDQTEKQRKKKVEQTGATRERLSAWVEKKRRRKDLMIGAAAPKAAVE